MTLAPETPPEAATPPVVFGGPQAAPDAAPRFASGAAAPCGTSSFLEELRHAVAACGCCAVLIDNEQQLREIRARHPEEFTGPASEPPNEHPGDRWEPDIEAGLGLPLEERLGGLVAESWL